MLQAYQMIVKLFTILLIFLKDYHTEQFFELLLGNKIKNLPIHISLLDLELSIKRYLEYNMINYIMHIVTGEIVLLHF